MDFQKCMLPLALQIDELSSALDLIMAQDNAAEEEGIEDEQAAQQQRLKLEFEFQAFHE